MIFMEFFPEEISGLVLVLRKVQWLYITVILLVGFLVQWFLTSFMKRTVIKKLDRQGKVFKTEKVRAIFGCIIHGTILLFTHSLC